MKTLSIISLRHLYISIPACVLTLMLSSTVSAQRITDGSTPLGVSSGAPTGSYALGDFDSVNLYNGSLNFRLPLVKISGRGGAGFTMVMRVEKKWLVDKEQAQPNRYTPNPNWWGLDGQEPIYSVGKLEMRQAGSRDFFISNPCGFIHSETLTRLTFTAPDGTEYELRDQSTNGRPDHPTCGSGGFNRGRVFITVDGSSATFISNADIVDYIYDNPANPPPSGNLVLRDGTRYVVSGGRVMSMWDRNGNRLTFSYSGLQLTNITDSLNRQVSISYSAPYDEIIVKGFGGVTRSIKIYKGSALRSDCSPQTYKQLFSTELNGASDATFTPVGVTSVQLPNGQQYQFYYNSYSELARVVLPTGGAVEYDYAPGLTDAVGGV